jgi:cation transport regulator
VVRVVRPIAPGGEAEGPSDPRERDDRSPDPRLGTGPRLSLDLRPDTNSAMPYVTNDDLPRSIQGRLPPHAQDIYRESFNHAFAAHAGDPRQEEAAHRIAWAAVKRSYVKVGDTWVAK